MSNHDIQRDEPVESYAELLFHDAGSVTYAVGRHPLVVFVEWLLLAWLWTEFHPVTQGALVLGLTLFTIEALHDADLVSWSAFDILARRGLRLVGLNPDGETDITLHSRDYALALVVLVGEATAVVLLDGAWTTLPALTAIVAMFAYLRLVSSRRTPTSGDSQ